MTDERRPVRVLLIEDDEDDYILTRDLLEQTGEPFELDWASSYDDGLAAIHRHEHDVYLIDYRLGSRDAADLLRDAHAATSDAPFIVFTGAAARESDLAAMTAGADDFLVKAHTTPSLLERAIRYAIERRRLMLQLREAQKLETIVALAGGIAHDFNNLLTTIVGYAQHGASELPNLSEVRHALDQISHAGTRAADLTRQLLAYAGDARRAPSRIDVAAELARIHGTLAALLPSHARLELDADPRAPAVLIADHELHELARQLVANAAEALDRTGGLVRVAADAIELAARELADYRHGRAAIPGRYARLAVSDDGAGMTPEIAARAFEPFYSTKFTGRGLGLAAVDGIVRTNNGAIRLASQPGHGTTIEITLPAANENH